MGLLDSFTRLPNQTKILYGYAAGSFVCYVFSTVRREDPTYHFWNAFARYQMECAKSIKITEGHWTEKVYKNFVAENAELGPVLKSSRNAWDMSVPCMIAGGTLGGFMALQGSPSAMKLLVEKGGLVNKVTAFCLGGFLLASITEFAIPSVLLPPREQRIKAHHSFINYLESKKAELTEAKKSDVVSTSTTQQ